MAEAYSHVTFRLATRLLSRLDRDAAERGLSRSDWLRAAIRDQLECGQDRAHFDTVAQALMQRIEDAQIALMQHVTREIDQLDPG